MEVCNKIFTVNGKKYGYFLKEILEGSVPALDTEPSGLHTGVHIEAPKAPMPIRKNGHIEITISPKKLPLMHHDIIWYVMMQPLKEYLDGKFRLLLLEDENFHFKMYAELSKDYRLHFHGYIQYSLHDDNRYRLLQYMSFVDEYYRNGVKYLIKRKPRTKHPLKRWVLKLQAQTCIRIDPKYHIDGWIEYCTKDLDHTKNVIPLISLEANRGFSSQYIELEKNIFSKYNII